MNVLRILIDVHRTVITTSARIPAHVTLDSDSTQMVMVVMVRKKFLNSVTISYLRCGKLKLYMFDFRYQ